MTDRQDDVRAFIVEHVEKHPTDIAKLVQEHFGITRQAAHKYLRQLKDAGDLASSGNTNSTTYSLPRKEQNLDFRIVPGLDEDRVWREQVAPVLEHLTPNSRNVWHYAFTEMFNNAVDHSEGSRLHVFITQRSSNTQIVLKDNGVGIFKKLRDALKLEDESHAVLELAKGKLTTDPTRHSGEGIFFTSRVLDGFSIHSGAVSYSHHADTPDEDWVMDLTNEQRGTAVFMELSNDCTRTTAEVFDKFATGEDFGFDKTVIPVELARHGDDNLVSRSQAKRLLARVEQFKVVILDFSGIESIGQAFADQVFRVFQNEHPDISIVAIETSPGVAKMIARAKAHSS